ncbi:MAG: hypothetical protein WC799_13905 [Desulfobacteraceae bacterium]|jgi:hypothetical protein
MDTKTTLTKIVGINKENFEKSYNYIVKIQDQVDEKVTAFVEGAAFIPAPVKDFYKQWTDTARNSREAIKKYADEGYQGIENYLATTA